MIGKLEVHVNQVEINKDTIRDIARQYLSEDNDKKASRNFYKDFNFEQISLVRPILETLTVRMKEVRPMSVVSSSDLLDTRAKLKGDTWHLKLLGAFAKNESWIISVDSFIV